MLKALPELQEGTLILDSPRWRWLNGIRAPVCQVARWLIARPFRGIVAGLLLPITATLIAGWIYDRVNPTEITGFLGEQFAKSRRHVGNFIAGNNSTEPPLTLETYLSMRSRMTYDDDQDFLDKVAGQLVNWTGFVADVRRYDEDRELIAISSNANAGSPFYDAETVFDGMVGRDLVFCVVESNDRQFSLEKIRGLQR